MALRITIVVGGAWILEATISETTMDVYSVVEWPAILSSLTHRSLEAAAWYFKPSKKGILEGVGENSPLNSFAADGVADNDCCIQNCDASNWKGLQAIPRPPTPSKMPFLEGLKYQAAASRPNKESHKGPKEYDLGRCG
jgi:hypothetical protein